MNNCLAKVLTNKSLPSPPTVAAEILKLAAQSDSTIDQMTHVVSADPVLSAQLISYCNSPVVGNRREIGSLAQAVVILGLRTVRLISLSFSLLEMKDNGGFDYDSFWRRSLATAIASQLTGKRSNGDSSESFLQGLLMNVGKIGLANTFPQQYAEMMEIHGANPTIEQESECFGTHRYEVGAEMLRQWHFPDSMVQRLSEYNPRQLNHRSRPFFLADMYAELLIGNQTSMLYIDQAKQFGQQWFGLDEIEFTELFDQMVQHWESYRTLFQFDAVPFDCLEALQAEAKQCLMDTAMGMELELCSARKMQQELKQTALIDVLTKLKNRQAYEAEVPGIVDYHRRQGKSFGILVIDIDHFKSINDTYGHAAGDEVLKAVGECLRQKCRKYDTVYRYGGEEFAATIVDCSESSIEIIANRFRASIEELNIAFGERMLRITASVGVCWAENGDVESLDDLFQIADARLYQAKHSGRNRCVFGHGRHACEI